MSELTTALVRVVRSPAFKFFLVSFLILLLLIPLLMVTGLIAERENRARGVRAEIARLWGRPQQLSGPFLVVPYTVSGHVMDGNKRIETTIERRAVFLPDKVDVKAKTKSKVLHRSIYRANVYEAQVAIEGRFNSPDLSEVAADAISVRWRDAIVAFALSDVSGLKQAAVMRVNGSQTIPFAPSLGVPAARQSGIHVRLAGAGDAVLPAGDAPPRAFTFNVDLTFSGSSTLDFTPAARETTVALEADWAHPGFSGSFLPVERKISDDGFSANWRVPHLARSVPQAWSLAEQGIDRLNPYGFGVSYYLPIDFYDMVSRAVKYGILFLGLAFMAVFVLELLSGRSVHPVQYLMVGTALVFFYVLLLSLAEHIGFGWAYLVAAVAMATMLSIYVGRALDSARLGAIMAGVLAVTYALLYLILRLEDYALLAGALMGFVMLTFAMFATLKVDWSGRARPPGGGGDA